MFLAMIKGLLNSHFAQATATNVSITKILHDESKASIWWLPHPGWLVFFTQFATQFAIQSAKQGNSCFALVIRDVWAQRFFLSSQQDIAFDVLTANVIHQQSLTSKEDQTSFRNTPPFSSPPHGSDRDFTPHQETDTGTTKYGYRSYCTARHR